MLFAHVYIYIYTLFIYFSCRCPNSWTKWADFFKGTHLYPGETEAKTFSYFSSKFYFFNSTGNAGHFS